MLPTQATPERVLLYALKRASNRDIARRLVGQIGGDTTSNDRAGPHPSCERRVRKIGVEPPAEQREREQRERERERERTGRARRLVGERGASATAPGTDASPSMRMVQQLISAARKARKAEDRSSAPVGRIFHGACPTGAVVQIHSCGVAVTPKTLTVRRRATAHR